MTELVRVEFSEEELRANVRVPETVEQRLCDTVEKLMNRSGMYNQVFSRIKTHHSLARKYKRKVYNENKKIQDLIGVRIDLYFEDDLKICRKMLERVFGEAEWSMSEASSDEFRPTKINGVFKLPAELRAMISDETWNYCIDDTFEIQLKTVFFEGWHEIEHDMKYKGTDLWADKGDRSRYFNTILATLELCDKSIVTLFENLGHDLYHEKNWAGMMKAHFRVKMLSDDLYPELQEYFRQDTSVDNIPKRIFKTKREDLINALLSRPASADITVNTIVALLNERVFKNPEIKRIVEENDVFNKRSGHFDEELRYQMKVPVFVDTFYAKVELEAPEGIEKSFSSAVKTAYSWVYNKYSGVLLNLSELATTQEIKELGFIVESSYDEENLSFAFNASQLDDMIPGRIWVTNCSINKDELGRLMLEVRNGFTYFENPAYPINRQKLFSCPRFYRQIVNQIGARDVKNLYGIELYLADSDTTELENLILSEDRMFPIVAVISENESDGRLDESWLGSFGIRYMLEKTGHYAHYVRANQSLTPKIFERMVESGCEYDNCIDFESYGQGIIVISPRNGNYVHADWFGEDYIQSCSYSTLDAIEHLQVFKDQDNVRAFGTELVQTIRRINTEYEDSRSAK